MKQLVFAVAALFSLATFCACQNEHAKFCTQVSQNLCAKCASCGADGLKKCVLTEAKDTASCQETLFNICEAYEPDYNRELARNCLNAINQSACDAPKPEACSRLF